MNNTIYARQIAPEYQESPFPMFEVWEDVIFIGNRYCEGRNAEKLNTLTKSFDEYLQMYEDVGHPDSYYKNVTELVHSLFPPTHKKRYSTKDILEWKRLALLCFANGEELDADMIIKGLHLMHGQAYIYDTIHGSSQSEWQDVYYPASYTKDMVQALECEYFNTGSEWVVHDGNEPPTNAGEIDGCYTYCHGCTDEEIAEEIRREFGKAGNKVILYKWEGYTKTPQYENVTIG